MDGRVARVVSREEWLGCWGGRAREKARARERGRRKERGKAGERIRARAWEWGMGLEQREGRKAGKRRRTELGKSYEERRWGRFHRNWGKGKVRARESEGRGGLQGGGQGMGLGAGRRGDG